jgi:plastocyanin
MLKIGLAVIGASLLAMSAAQAATVDVTINNYTYTPDKVAVHPGDVVLFSNQDSVPHTVTALDGKSFDSGAINPGGSWSVTVKAPGTYKFRCNIHPEMLGEIDVE